MATLVRRYEYSTLVTLFAKRSSSIGGVMEIIFFIPLLTGVVSVKILFHSHVCERDDTIFIRTTLPLYNIHVSRATAAAALQLPYLWRT